MSTKHTSFAEEIWEIINNFNPKTENDLPKRKNLSKYIITELISGALKRKGGNKINRLKALIQILPKSIVMALGPKLFRAVIITAENNDKTFFKIEARDFNWRHPPGDKVLRDKMPLIKHLVESSEEEKYIENPISHNWTANMRQLVEDKNINAIFATTVKMDEMIIILVVDATGEQKGIDSETKFFLKRISKKVWRIEKELQKLDELQKKAREAQTTTILYLFELVLDALQTKIMQMGGTCLSIVKNAKPECEKCRAKAESAVGNAEEIEKIFGIMRQTLHDIKKAELIIIKTYSINEILQELNAPNAIYRFAKPDIMINTDKRKLIKFLQRLIGELQKRNENPIGIVTKKMDDKIQIKLSQENIAAHNIQKLTDMTLTGEANGHTIFELPLICSIILLLREIGGEIKTTKTAVIISLPI